MTDEVSLLYPANEIRRAVGRLAGALASDHAGRTPVLVTVLKGGTTFLADLIRAMSPMPLRVDFMAISPYGENTGVVKVVMDLERDIGGEHVVVVEDIIDTGLTLSYLLGALAGREPASLEVCTLLDKSARRIAPLEIRYRGFECPDRFVIGYGLDFRGRYRNLPDILAVRDPAALVTAPLSLGHLFEGRLPEVPGAGTLAAGG